MVEKIRKRCPYCGHEDTEVINIYTSGIGSGHVVKCLSCGQHGPMGFVANNGDNVQEMVADSIGLAIKLYNRRYS